MRNDIPSVHRSFFNVLNPRQVAAAAFVVTAALVPVASAQEEVESAAACVAVVDDQPLPPSFKAVDVPEGAVRRAQTTMGTTLSLGASNVACEIATEAFAEVYREFDRLERLTSTNNPTSDLSRINDAAGVSPVEVDPEVFALIEMALSFAEQTDGAFDPTFAAMDGVWKFDATAQVAPAADIERARQLVDYRQVVLDKERRKVFLAKTGMRLSLGGIVKGYATDNAVTILKRRGLTDFIIRSGGEVFIQGNPGGGHRRIGIPRPRSEGVLALLDLTGGALNVSRDVERSFISNDVRYHHIIDPRTGYPAHHCRTVAVVAPRAATADALSTAIFVLGPVRGLKLIEARPGVEALIVDSEHGVHLSSGMADLATLRAPGAATH